MMIIDHKKNSIINIEGSWHITVLKDKLWLFPSIDEKDFATANHYEFDLDYSAEELMRKFSFKLERFNLNKDVEVFR